MASLARCITKTLSAQDKALKKVFKKADGDALLKRAKELQRAGRTSADANLAALSEAIDDAYANLVSAHEQLGLASPEPRELPKPPEPQSVAAAVAGDRQGLKLASENVTKGEFDQTTGSVFVPVTYDDGRIGAIEYTRGGEAINAPKRYQQFKGRLEPVTLQNGRYVLTMPPDVRHAVSQLDRDYLAAVQRGDMATAQRMVDEAADVAGYRTRVMHGTDKARNIFDGGAFFTDSARDASAYAELRALRKAVEDNDELSEIVFDVLAEVGGEELTDLGPGQIKDIADANGIDLTAADGTVMRGRIKTGNVIDLRSVGVDVGHLASTWDELHSLGLLDESWSSLDDETKQELGDKYKDKALYRLLESEGVIAKAFTKGYDTVIFRDKSPIDNSSHQSWATKDVGQFKSTEPVTRDDAGNIIPLSQRFNIQSSDIRYAARDQRGGVPVSQVEADIKTFLGVETLPESITVMSDPEKPYAAIVTNRDKIEINAANIQPGGAGEIVFHEGLHGVWYSPEVQAAWQPFRDAVTQAEIDDQMVQRKAAGLTVDEKIAREEAAVARAISQLLTDRPLWKRLLDAIANAFFKVFGIRLPRTNDQLLIDATIRFLRGERHSLPGKRLIASNAVIVAPGLSPAYAVTAYHGTPHTFTPEPGAPVGRFKTEKVGTGEGAQVYGWGLYFAGLRGVGEHYRESLSRERMFVDGQEVPDDSDIPEAYAARLVFQHGDDAIKVAQEEALSERREWWAKEYYESVIKEIKVLAGKKIEVTGSGHLLTVSLNVNDDEWLDWNKPLSEQPPHIKVSLAPLFQMISGEGDQSEMMRDELLDAEQNVLLRGAFSKVYVFGNNAFTHSKTVAELVDGLTGEGVYGIASITRPGPRRHMSPEKAASEYLASLGLKGVRYLDQGSRGLDVVESQTGKFEAGDRSFNTRAEAQAYADSKRTYNYVVFNPSDIVITERDGTPVPLEEAMGSEVRHALPQKPGVFASRSELAEAQTREGSLVASVQLGDIASAQANIISPSVLASIATEQAPDPADTRYESQVKNRIKSGTKFLEDLRDMASGAQIQTILSGTDPEHVKQAAAAAVLAQVGNIRANLASTDHDKEQTGKKLQGFQGKLNALAKAGLAEQLSGAAATEILEGERDYLQNLRKVATGTVQAHEQEARRILAQRLNDWEQSPSAIIKAVKIVADAMAASTTTITQGYVAAFARTILTTQQVGQDVIDFLTLPKTGGAPAGLDTVRAFNGLQQLINLKANEAQYRQEIADFQDLFRMITGKSPSDRRVSLRQFAQAYHRLRTKQTKAHKIVETITRELQDLSEDMEVYEAVSDYLNQILDAPELTNAYAKALDEAHAMLHDDAFIKKDNDSGDFIYTSPLKITDPTTGETRQNEYRIPIGPDKLHDERAIQATTQLVDEIDQWLRQPGNDPIEERTWRERMDYLRKNELAPQFEGTLFHRFFGDFFPDIFQPMRWLFRGYMQSAQNYARILGFRAGNDALRILRSLDQVRAEARLTENSKQFGHSAINNLVRAALDSHGFKDEDRWFWKSRIMEPFLAAQQYLGNVVAGELIPGTAERVTKEDVAAADAMKKFSMGILKPVQRESGVAFSYHNPMMIEDTVAGVRAKREAVSPGKYTLPRRPNTDVYSPAFLVEWNKATPDERRAMIQEGNHFFGLVIRYLGETDLSFKFDTPLERVYRRWAAQSKTDPSLAFSTLDQLVEWLAKEAVDMGIYADIVDARVDVPQRILAEVSRNVAAFAKYLKDEDEETKKAIPDPLIQAVTAHNPFTRPRGPLLFPSAFFTYALVTDVSRLHHVGSAMSLFQLSALEAMTRLKKSIDQKLDQLNQQIQKRLVPRTTSKRAATKMVTRESRREKQARISRFDYDELERISARLGQILTMSKASITHKPSDYDSTTMFLIGKGKGNLASWLLSSITSIGANIVGGAAAIPYMNAVQIARFNLMFIPKQVAGLAGMAVKRLLLSVRGTGIFEQVAKGNIPLLTRAANLMVSAAVEWQAELDKMVDYNLIIPDDLASELRAARNFRETGGRINPKDLPWIARMYHRGASLPVINEFFGWLKSTSPRVFEDVANSAMAQDFEKNVLGTMRTRALDAMSARERLYGQVELKDFTFNPLQPAELGLSTWRQLTVYRELFSPAASLEFLMSDYYERWKAAAPADQAAVPLFRNPADMKKVMYSYGTHTNIPTETTTPAIMRGKGIEGQVRGLAFMFMSYATKFTDLWSDLAATDLRDPPSVRRGNALRLLILVLLGMFLAGGFSRETSQPIKQAVTGAAPSGVMLANVLEDPDLWPRYIGINLAQSFPFYGEKVSRLLGNPAYRPTPFDLTEMIPVAGLARDASKLVTEMYQSETVGRPVANFINRWMPPAQPMLRLFPGWQGDLEAQNAARALRIAAPEDMELASQRGGGYYRQTPASAEVRSLVSAAFRGDKESVKRFFDRAVAEKVKAGQEPEDAAQSVLQTVKAQMPARKVFGKALTPGDEARVVARMTAGQKEDYARSKEAFGLIGSALGSPMETLAVERRQPIPGTLISRRLSYGGRTRRTRLRGRRAASGLRRRTRARMPRLRARRSRSRRQRRNYALAA